jgi:hypothetical protein
MGAYDDVKAVVTRRAHIVGDKPLLSSLTQTELERLIDASIQEYSEHEPDRAVFELAGSLVVDSLFALNAANLGAAWVRRTDRILEIETPIDQPRAVLMNEPEDYRLVEQTTGVFAIRFYINPSDPWRLSIERAWNITTVELDPVATQRVGLNAAAKACRVKAAKYSDTNDPTFAADALDYRSKGTDWLALAEALESEYTRAINPPADHKAAGAQVARVDIDQSFAGQRGRNYLVHRYRRR